MSVSVDNVSNWIDCWTIKSTMITHHQATAHPKHSIIHYSTPYVPQNSKLSVPQYGTHSVPQSWTLSVPQSRTPSVPQSRTPPALSTKQCPSLSMDTVHPSIQDTICPSVWDTIHPSIQNTICLWAHPMTTIYMSVSLFNEHHLLIYRPKSLSPYHPWDTSIWTIHHYTECFYLFFTEFYLEFFHRSSHTEPSPKPGPPCNNTTIIKSADYVNIPHASVADTSPTHFNIKFDWFGVETATMYSMIQLIPKTTYHSPWCNLLLQYQICFTGTCGSLLYSNRHDTWFQIRGSFLPPCHKLILVPSINPSVVPSCAPSLNPDLEHIKLSLNW